MHSKKLYRSKNNRVIAGICGGLAEYADMDPTLIRALVVILTLVTGLAPFLLGYFVAIFLIPENPNENNISSPPKTSL